MKNRLLGRRNRCSNPKKNSKTCPFDTIKKTIYLYHLCGRKNNRKVRPKLMKGLLKTDLYLLIEELPATEITEEGHSDICIRNCTGRLVTLDRSLTKFKMAMSLLGLS